MPVVTLYSSTSDAEKIALEYVCMISYGLLENINNLHLKHTSKLLQHEIILQKTVRHFLHAQVRFLISFLGFSNININHMSLTQSIYILIQCLHIKCMMYSWTQHNIFYERHRELLANKKYIWLWCSRTFSKTEKLL